MDSQGDDRSVWLFVTAGMLLLAALGVLLVGAGESSGPDKRLGPARSDVVLRSLGDDVPKSSVQTRYGGSWSLHQTPDGIVGVHHR